MALTNFIIEHVDNNITLKDIEEFEKRFSIKLPQKMKNFYLKHNGGNLKECGNKLFDLPLHILLPLIRTFNENIETIDQYYICQKQDGFIPDIYIPFCEDIGGDSYYVCLNDENYGKIYYIFSEFLDDFLKCPEDYLIAHDFEEFLQMVN